MAVELKFPNSLAKGVCVSVINWKDLEGIFQRDGNCKEKRIYNGKNMHEGKDLVKLYQG